MAFYIVEGLPGGGKSYFAAEMALKAMREGAIVHTNLPIYDGTIEQDGEHPNEVEKRGLTEFFRRIPSNPRCWVKKHQTGEDEAGDPDFEYTSDYILGGAEGAENLVICDEAALKMRTRTQAKDAEKNEPIEDLVRLARHGGLEIYFLTQDNSQVVAKLRPMADYRILCSNVSKLPLIGGFCAMVFGTFRRTYFQRQASTPYARHHARFSAEVATFYRTDAMRSVLKVEGKATRQKGSSSIGRALAIKYGLLLALCIAVICTGAYFFTRTVSDVTGGHKPQTASEQKVKTQTIDAEGNVKTREESRPERPPAGLVELTWDSYDEHVIASVVRRGGVKTVWTRGGRKLGVGLFYEGQPIKAGWTYGGWWYFITITDRLIVARPMLPEEREQLPPVTVPGIPGERALDAPSAVQTVKEIMPSL